MEALVGAAEVEVVELEAPISTEGEVGDNVVTHTRPEAHEILRFALSRSSVINAY